MTDEEDSETAVVELQGGEENELPTIQLCELVEELSYGNSALKTETEMFEKYYNKLEPRDQRHPRLSEIISGAEFAQFRGKHRSKSRIGMDHVIGLSCDQKCELVQKELEDMKDEIRHMRANAERDLQHHEAIIEEAEIRWTEVQRAVHEFKKDILKTISKKKGSILATQKVMKYIEDMNRRRDNMKDKLRLKNVSLKVQRKKMLLQLRQKEEVGEALHDVDFQQLKIENAQFLETIEAKNQELIQLKLASGNTLQVLNAYKSKLYQAMEMSVNLDKEILLRNELLEKIERETLQVEEDRAKAEALNKKLRKQLAEFRSPQVMLYVRENILNGDLEKTIKMWERKVEIAEMSLKGYRKAWNKMKTTNEQLQALCPPQEIARGRPQLQTRVIH
ncbi:cilia- and flagella-associated protein 263 isoform X5 [Canis lupus baileyi]|uniref:Cilia- and flagella-associated protein 263 n=1 Tax=Canis lupus dingo TaxID=286419 RepID=A0A8C0QY92_CANLU|nr:coiled-coil domain-containing protein 113 isoform X5 [Canis lupus dingo]XP_038386837.1 coiled-coil domain-containing protein 113 isoform X4 [Canis lupus familiaris]XP_038515139.1 coiled-coil domain-containing protein 113 isoform X4 [Canis lupus familiaris]XP_544381.2 coiled-coil domain-containing protein 113 isoform X4 [Canis lupus familiaris]|eukprot:XP_544381.2 coiled-coil domain-containing protein 113 isoform X2 [Canis lupus familiaris]